MPGVHARLSASGAYRWMACPGSVKLEAGLPERSSSYAEEGSFAHSVAELMLRYNNNEMTKAAYTRRLNKLKEDKWYSPELEGCITDYTVRVWEEMNAVRRECPDAQILFEQRLDFSAYVPGGFGTGDVVIIAEPALHVIDLKYGQGVPVSAEENPQLKLYALGALEEYGDLYDIRRVVTTIVQPRLDSITTYGYTAEDLAAWGRDVAAPKAAEALQDGAPFCPGHHCQFCRAKALCRARAEENQKLAALDFTNPPLLSEEEIAGVLAQAEQLASWAKDVQEYAFEEALKGKKWTGWKLVEGRSIRKYTDEAEAAKALLEAGQSEERIYKPKALLGITDMTKLLGRKQFEEILSGYIKKPAGKPVLVPESDKRPEWNSAEEDFKEEKG